jgi:hypothetical protein
MLNDITPNLDGMYPLANFGPPPSPSAPVLSKRPRKAAKLSDGSAAYLVPSTEDLEKLEEIRKQKSEQRALKRAGNVSNPGRVAKRYVARPAGEFSWLIGTFKALKPVNGFQIRQNEATVIPYLSK